MVLALGAAGLLLAGPHLAGNIPPGPPRVGQQPAGEVPPEEPARQPKEGSEHRPSERPADEPKKPQTPPAEEKNDVAKQELHLNFVRSGGGNHSGITIDAAGISTISSMIVDLPSQSDSVPPLQHQELSIKVEYHSPRKGDLIELRMYDLSGEIYGWCSPQKTVSPQGTYNCDLSLVRAGRYDLKLLISGEPRFHASVAIQDK